MMFCLGNTEPVRELLEGARGFREWVFRHKISA
jgi:hypothetical protein